MFRQRSQIVKPKVVGRSTTFQLVDQATAGDVAQQVSGALLCDVVTLCTDALIGMTEAFLSDPRHFFRSYSVGELGRMMTASAPRSVPAP
jgi:hypothetical protein